MINKRVEESIKEHSPVRLYLISGETFEGICEENFSDQFVHLNTGNGIISFPLWVVKYIRLQPL
ncbi:hypothetical protein NST94_02405 [Paenibacillus sp. FSL H8-0282]|uniref:hypothetical protein n=1 Tax=unclassified Paenibacillus TaxID=185978 RepID=UPI0030CAB49D